MGLVCCAALAWTTANGDLLQQTAFMVTEQNVIMLWFDW